ncbi:NAD(P)-dependent oxidoreductase [Bernardetia sp. Wsw4-3y2]|uniref:NAD(P)-dependent oxidoreductase n=1 Tax=Bernardetia sp. Wsw4-3y2 TaxID=3127471 RepID=UPI0030D2DD2C
MQKIALIREGKTPPDRRVALTPTQCKEVLDKYKLTDKDFEILVQPSPIRCFSDEEYKEAGCRITEDINEASILLGVKEVPKPQLIPNKTYLFFSHTIKKQPYNRDLLEKIIEKNIRLIDYEVLTNAAGQRVIAFGRYAGIVGAYNGILTYGKRFDLFDLKPANECFDMDEMWSEFEKVKLPTIKIAVTGGGRVAKGSVEVLEGMKIKEVSPEDYLNKEFDEAVFTRLRSQDYHFKKGQTKENKDFDLKDFYNNATDYNSHFSDFTKKTDLLIAAAYWNPKSPVLFTKEEMKQNDFKIKVIADITCDIEGSIPSTSRPSTIAEPFYDYNVETESEEKPFSDEKNITVMAVDNLPCELPRDASRDFGRELIDQVLPYLLFEDNPSYLKEHNFTDGNRIARANLTKDKDLTAEFEYLRDYLEGK